MSKEITLFTEYVVSGISTKDSKRVYQGTDSHSGGYPYWTSYFGNADKLKSASEASKRYKNNDEFLKREVKKVEILQVQATGTVISTEDIISEEKAKAMAEIEKIQKDLEARVAALQEMK